MPLTENIKKQLFYTEFFLSSDQEFGSYEFDKPQLLSNLALVNIFVGANNSGKSRLLRQLFSSNEIYYNTNFFTGNELANHLPAGLFNSDWGEKYKAVELNKLLRMHLMNANSKEFLSANKSFQEQMVEFFRSASNFASYETKKFDHSPHRINEVNRFLDLCKQFFMSQNAAGLQIGQEAKYYIPILRGMRSPDDSKTDANHYASRTTKDYFRNLNGLGDGFGKPNLFTGLELYQELKKKLLGEPEDRDSVKEFEDFLQKYFFDGKVTTLIPREGADVVHVKIGSEKQFPIYQLGDGLQNLIIITYLIFTKKYRCLFFIEEPEISMHPGMQRAVLEIMKSHSHHQYFITTHSNHLLDMSSEYKGIAIYHVSKESTEKSVKHRVSQVASPNINILKELGVHNSSVFLTNASIWVEGITDRLYLRAYFNKYLSTKPKGDLTRNFREDFHFSFVEYQGSNLTHWTFDNNDQSSKIKAHYLCGHSFLIADGDIAAKGSRQEDYKKMLGDRFFVFDCKEIENLIPVQVLKEIMKKDFQNAGKNESQIDFSEYSKSEAGLGKYLDTLIDKNEHLGTETGTIKNKVNFCEKAIELMSKTDFVWTLNPPLNALCEKLYNFILEQNK